MHIPIDKIVFGNPSSKDHRTLQMQTYLDRLIPELQQYPPPKNSSKATMLELERLMDLLSTPREIQNNLYDQGLLSQIKQIFVKAGADPEEIDSICTAIAEDVIPLLTKLKYFFNRPRPSQLAFYYNIQLYPDFSYFTNTPSYPSSHTALTAVTGEVLGNYYPESYRHMQALINDVLQSRLYLGVHYASDNDTSMFIASRILKVPEFIARYKL